MQKFKLMGLILTLLVSIACNIDTRKPTGDESEKLPASLTETGDKVAVRSEVFVRYVNSADTEVPLEEPDFLDNVVNAAFSYRLTACQVGSAKRA